MAFNPFGSRVIYENDPDDFRLPYRLQSRTDIEVMTEKYSRLRKFSYGYVVRLGIPDKRQSW